MLLQAFDFHVLCRDCNCELQIGGSDQWGNITAGIDLCRKKAGKTVFGLTLPLITKADGTKFGKTEAGAIWLDPKRTSVYHFYQFWINTDDRDVIRYLKYFTFLSKEEIESLEKQHAENPGARVAHKALAKAATDLIHGESATTEAVRASEILFGGELKGIAESTFNEILGEVPTKEIEKVKIGWRGNSAGGTFGSRRFVSVQRPGAKRHRRRRREHQQRPRSQRHARGDRQRFAFRQTRPAPQRQKELRRRDGEVKLSQNTVLC